MLNTARKIHQTIADSNRIIVVMHQNPDGDAIGSVGAIVEYLKKLDKNVGLFCTTEIPNHLNFIPHSNLIENDMKIFDETYNADTIIVLDSGDLRYAGIDEYVKEHKASIINIDHNPTNARYGHLNLVNENASSTTEILYHYFVANNIFINPTIATSLLTGIITDTGNFTNSATSINSVNIAGSLLRSGANLNLINKKTLQNNTICILKLWGVVLNRLEYLEESSIAYTYLTRQDYETHSVDEQAVDGIANFMNTISGVKIGLFLKETNDKQIKGSFRTTHDNVDVSAVAKQLGGGGHKKAAGFTADGTIEEVLKKVLTMVG